MVGREKEKSLLSAPGSELRPGLEKEGYVQKDDIWPHERKTKTKTKTVERLQKPGTTVLVDGLVRS